MAEQKHNKLIIIGVVVALFLVAAFFLFPEPQPETEVVVIKQEVYIPPPPMESKKSPVQFTDVSNITGIDFKHFGGGFKTRDGENSRYMPETMGPGVALFDYDSDGDLDFYVTNSTSFPGHSIKGYTPTGRLYRNDGEFKFTDVTKIAGLDFNRYSMGVMAVDYNGDRHQDLLITTLKGVILFKGSATGKFSNVTEAVGLANKGEEGESNWTTGAVMFDADGDSDLDLLVVSYVVWSPEGDIYSTMDGKRKSFAVPDIYEGDTPHFYLQENGVFVDVTEKSGIENFEGKALGVALWDFDHDGKLDIVVSNDTQPNFFYQNLGGGKFEERGMAAGIAYDENGKTRAGMGIDIADIFNDGTAAIAIGNFSREPTSIFKMSGSGFFREASQQLGVAVPTNMILTFGLRFADMDLDGWLDIVMANGHVEPTIQDVEAEISYAQPLSLLGNTRNGQFTDWSESAGAVFNTPMVGRGLAVGDLDADGDLDMIVTENNGALKIIRNDIKNAQYLRVTLIGSPPNTDAIGAMLELHAGGSVQKRMVRTGSSYLSQSELTQTFGLGDYGSIDKLIITWPNGHKQELTKLVAGKTIKIDQVSGQVH